VFNPDPTYNTIMAVGAGLGLVLIVALGYQLERGQTVHRQAWAAAFFALGAILALTGLHMTLTWPLSGPTAFDNIAFGEPSLAMGVLLVVGSWLLGSRRAWQGAAGTAATSATGATVDVSQELTAASWPHLARLLQPLSWFAFVMGFALIAIAFVGPIYEPWEAPPQEPITGEFTNHQVLENTFLALLYAGTGLGAILLPFALLRRTLEKARGLLKVVGALWLVTGVVWVAFGALNYYTHIGLTINTYKESTQKQNVQETP
jgi:uncharacterized membrane protein